LNKEVTEKREITLFEPNQNDGRTEEEKRSSF
jgi:hypothetical protein